MPKICRTILITLCAIVIAIGSTACKNNESDSNAMYGDWQFCGVVEKGAEYAEENIITGDEFLDAFGADEMPDSGVSVDKEGIKGIFDNVPGTEVGEVEQINDTQFRQPVKIKMMDGKKLDELVEIDIYVTLKGKYLFVESTYVEDEYDSDNVNVYKRAE